jgi:TupA-like ATPgrasp
MSELVQWRKIVDRNPVFCIFSDKLLAKKWVSERCSLKIPWPLWFGVDPSAIPDEFLLPGFVIKTNHATTQNYFTDASKSRQEIESLFRKYLLVNQAETGDCEWAYGAIDRKVFVEKYISGRVPLMDISVRAHDGHISLVSIATFYKTPDSRISYFYPNGSRHQGDDEPALSLSADFKIPKNFHEAINYAESLSRGIDYVRVDFLSTGEELFFGELTLYPATGFALDGERSRIVLGEWLKHIRLSWFFKQKFGYFKRQYQFALLRHFSHLSQQHLENAEHGSAR